MSPKPSVVKRPPDSSCPYVPAQPASRPCPSLMRMLVWLRPHCGSGPLAPGSPVWGPPSPVKSSSAGWLLPQTPSGLSHVWQPRRPTAQRSG